MNQSPDDNFKVVEYLKADSQEPVMMVGDGLNDAGALSKSDVGISISSDVYQFSPASDAILAASSIESFESFIISI